MSARWWTFLVWALVALSALAWGLKIFVRPQPVPPQAQIAGGPVAGGDMSRVLGADAPPPVAVAPAGPADDARFNLIGVVSPRSARAAREGIALIAIDGKPPRTFRVGAAVDGDNVLQTVEPRGVTIGPRDGAALIALKLPPPPSAATGTLPPAISGGGFVQPFVPSAAPPAVFSQPAPPPGAYVPAAPQPQGPPLMLSGPGGSAVPQARPAKPQTAAPAESVDGEEPRPFDLRGSQR